MTQKAILYDASKCMACRGCQAACKQWNDLPAVETVNRGSYENPPALSSDTWLKIKFIEVSRNGDGGVAWLFNRRACMHCTDAGCVMVCPTGAVYHHELGFVAQDTALCSGCGYCEHACPFHVPRLSGSQLTGLRTMHKCNFCQGRVSQGLEPACVKACPTGALQFGDRGELLLEAQKRVEVLKAIRDPVAGESLYPNAILYGDTEMKGVHVLYVWPDGIENYEHYRVDPKIPTAATNRQRYLRPLGRTVFGLVGAALAVNFIVARSRMVREKEGK